MIPGGGLLSLINRADGKFDVDRDVTDMTKHSAGNDIDADNELRII